LSLVSLFIVMAYSIPYMLVVLGFVSIPYILTSQFYRWPARDLRRLEAMSKSPINSHFSETLRGIDTIRNFGQGPFFFSKFVSNIDRNICCYWNRWCANQWVTVVLETIGNFFTLGTCLCAIWAAKNGYDVGKVGILLSYSVLVPGLIGWLSKKFVTAELESVSLERIFELESLPREPSGNVMSVEPEPVVYKPNIKTRDLFLKYDGSDAVILDRISMEIPYGSKVALIGRTGSGKSSIFSVLMRFYEFEGSILLNSLELKDVELASLRRTVSLIAQKPSLFGRTIREALVGSQHHVSDQDIFRCLSTVALQDAVPNLDAPIDSENLAFSAGQLQLLCLARALLRKVSCSLHFLTFSVGNHSMR